MAKLAPGVIYLGINDQSGRTLTPTPTSIPDCLTHHQIFTESGDGFARLVSGAAMINNYGANSFDPSSVYYNHATPYAKTAEANTAIMLQRLIPPDATKALLRVSIERAPSKLPNYARNSDGSIQYTGTGASATPVLDSTTPSINGSRLVLHVGVSYWVGNAQNFGGASIVDSFRPGSTAPIGSTSGITLGTYTNPTGGVGGAPIDVVGSSTLYPIIDAEYYSEGIRGNRNGLSISTPTIHDSEAYSLSFSDALKSFMYRFGLFERPSNSIIPASIPTVLGDKSLDLTLNGDTTNPLDGEPISFEGQMVDAYKLAINGYIPEPPPFGRVVVYHDSINTLLEVLTQGESLGGVAILGEKDYDATAVDYGRDAAYAFADTTNMGLLNLFSGQDWNGVPYFTIDVANSALFGGISMSTNISLYASGGSDGLALKTNGTPDRQANALLFDQMIITEFDNYGQGLNQLLDQARFPIRGYWDPGYSRDAKSSMMKVIGLRPDVYVVLSTQSIYDWVGDRTDPLNFKKMTANNEATDLAIALSLKTQLALYPESTVYNTPICRGVVQGQCGSYVTDPSRPLTPATIDFLDKITWYMGSESWIPGRAPDAPSTQPGVPSANKLVKKIQDVNNTWTTPAGYDQSWMNGMMYCQFYDNSNLFYPAFPTVYTDDTSVLKSFFTMAACCSLELLHFNVWKQLTPTGKLTDDELVAESNKLFENGYSNKFDGRFVITADTFFTGTDLANNRSWSSNTTIYANADRNQQYSTVTTQRMSALTATAGATA